MFRLKARGILLFAICIILFVIVSASILYGFPRNVVADSVDLNNTAINNTAINNTAIDDFLSNKKKVNDSRYIKHLAEKRNKLTMDIKYAVINSDEYNNLKEQIEEIDKEMEEAGCYSMDTSEVSSIFTNNKIVPLIDNPMNPSDTEDVKWWSYQYNKKYRDKTYTVFELMAMPTGNEVAANVDRKLYSEVTLGDQTSHSDFTTEVIGFYLGNIVDSITGYLFSDVEDAYNILKKLVPFEQIGDELFEGDSTQFTVTKYSGLIRTNSTMMYTFVYNDNKGYEGWEFMMTTHYTNVREDIMYYLTDEFGRFDSDTAYVDFNVHSENYDNVNWALYNFEEYRTHLHTNRPLNYCIEGVTMDAVDTEVFVKFNTCLYPGDLLL